LYDVYVSLEYAPTDRLLIEIKQKQTMSDFYRSVKEALECKYYNFNGLKKLRIKEMKVPILDQLQPLGKKDHGYQYDKETKFKYLEDDEDALCYLNFYNNAHVLVVVESQDIWLNCTVFLRSPDFTNFEANFEIKVDMCLNGKELRVQIMKNVIKIWNNLCMQKQSSESLTPKPMFSESIVDTLGKDEANDSMFFVLTQLDVYRNLDYEIKFSSREQAN
jgi:hypothetical protein